MYDSFLTRTFLHGLIKSSSMRSSGVVKQLKVRSVFACNLFKVTVIVYLMDHYLLEYKMLSQPCDVH